MDYNYVISYIMYACTCIMHCKLTCINIHCGMTLLYQWTVLFDIVQCIIKGPPVHLKELMDYSDS